MSRFYRTLRWVVRTALWFYYSGVEIHGLGRDAQPGAEQGGSEPRQRRPRLLFANHHGGMIDPMLLFAACERPVRFLAKAPLFDIAVLGWFLRGLEVVPVWRQQDPGYVREKNEALYDAVAGAFARGEAVAIFPEGKSHEEAYLDEFKHGGARMALEAEAAADFRLGLELQPVGVHFERTKVYRGRALLDFGQPFTIADLEDDYRRDPRETVEALTRTLRERLAVQVLEAEDHGALRLATLAERLGALGPPGEGTLEQRVARRKALLAGHARLASERPEEAAALVAGLSDYAGRLTALGLSDVQVAERPALPSALSFALVNGLLLVLGLPFLIVGTLLHAVPYLIARAFAIGAGPREDMKASVGLLVAIAAFPFWYALLAWLAFGFMEPLTASLLLAAAPLTGVLARRSHDRWRRMRRATWGAWLSLRRPDALEHLRAERAELRARLDALVGELAPELRVS